jgi:hypothetical protein
MPDIDALLDALKDEVADLAKAHLQAMQDEAVQDGEEFLRRTRDDLERWARLLEEGELSRDEFESLVRGQKDLAEMKALKRVGLAAAEADRFREALLDRIVTTAAGMIL